MRECAYLDCDNTDTRLFETLEGDAIPLCVKHSKGEILYESFQDLTERLFPAGTLMRTEALAVMVKSYIAGMNEVKRKVKQIRPGKLTSNDL